MEARCVEDVTDAAATANSVTDGQSTIGDAWFCYWTAPEHIVKRCRSQQMRRQRGCTAALNMMTVGGETLRIDF